MQSPMQTSIPRTDDSCPGGSMRANLNRRDELKCSLSVDRNLKRNQNDERGFSLMELLIVVTIILTIAALATPSLLASIDQARIARAVGDINAIEIDITEYQITNGAWPNTLADVGRSAMVDPWGHPYQYFNQATGTGNGLLRQDQFLLAVNSDFDLYSLGKDGQTAAPIASGTGRDDIIRGSNGSYIGPANLF